MKRLVWTFAVVACLAPQAGAQNHAELGAYVDYFHLSQTSTNQVGIGGRLGIHISPHVEIESEVAYDFAQAFTEGFASAGGGTATFVRTNARVLHGLFGPKFENAHGPLRLFVTAKGGFINFRLDPRPATLATFISSVNNLRASDVSGVFYPGVGAEAHVGPLGLRLDVGDEMYFSDGTHHNLRITFGPILRF